MGDSVLLHIYCSPPHRGSFSEDPRIRFHLPIRRGDLVELASCASPSQVLIVDGLFAGPLTVSGTECRDLMDVGWRLYGCSSLGALRAAELFPLGMIGLGRIYDLLRVGIVTDDAELAVAYHPQTWREMTVPLIDLRCRLMDSPQLSTNLKEEIWNAAKSIFYTERTEGAILEALAMRRSLDHASTAFIKSLPTTENSQKFRDASYAINLLIGKRGHTHATSCDGYR